MKEIIENSISIPKRIFTNNHWLSVYWHCLSQDNYPFDDAEYHEAIGVSYSLNPLYDHVASQNSKVFDLKKAAAMYFWYKTADREDTSIIKYFPEYQHCIDENHKLFNSNYGYYANHGLDRCIEALVMNKNSRQACFIINNNEAMSRNSIDKLCTNAVMFFIRGNCLHMIVQMRSSNLLTLLPYDMFIFSTWYAKVYNQLIKVYPMLRIAVIKMQVASLHFYTSDFYAKQDKVENNHSFKYLFSYDDICDHNFENILESKLVKLLNS